MPKRLEPKKSLGQHFLNNERIPKKMADAAKLTKGETVLEIGPGTGVLTRELLLRGTRVIAAEADPRAIESLGETFRDEIASGKLTVHHADMRSAKLSEFGLTEHSYKVVANIPYYLSGKLFRTLLESDTQPSCIVFLVQREVAERIACLRRGRGRQAKDEKESILSLSVKVYGDPRYIATVKRGNFTPQPQVDSAITAVENISHERFEGMDEAFFFEMLHLGFGSKRKQLLGNLAGRFKRKELTHIFSTLGIALTARAEDLTIDIWLRLVRVLQDTVH